MTALISTMTFSKQIKSASYVFERPLLVVNRQRNFFTKRNVPVGQLDRQTFLVNRLQKTAPNPFVDFKTRSQDRIGLFFKDETHRRIP